MSIAAELLRNALLCLLGLCVLCIIGPHLHRFFRFWSALWRLL